MLEKIYGFVYKNGYTSWMLAFDVVLVVSAVLYVVLKFLL